MYAGHAIHKQSLAPGYLVNQNYHRRVALGVESKARLGHRKSEERRMGQWIGIRRKIEGNKRGKWMDLISEQMVRVHAHVTQRVVSAGVRSRF